ncbi:uncharacterized protein LOC128742139 [Sabethes cyaneus]|uniref:uncharacterized protein LOC128742139 n=1 Tax=Sabethes cyaneus TaxID=53552 RepID=UPI00237E90D3|nr:uncharacterized protein LOC128742139 [Sabethes cyaneus]
MSRCRVVSCLNKRGQVKFYRFPRDPERCARWVQFCHCTETEERFKTMGVKGVRNFSICSEHFEPSLVRMGHLPADAVPISIGRTYMTPEMLIERGFNVELQVKAEPEPVEWHTEEVYIPDEVLIEMFCPEDVKVEPNEEEQSDPEIVENPVTFPEIQGAALTEHSQVAKGSQNLPEATESATLRKDTDSITNTPVPKSIPACKGICASVPSFKQRWKVQELKNHQLVNLIQKNQQRYIETVAKVKKLTDTLALKKQKRDRLKERYKEVKKQRKKAVIIPDLATESDDDDEGDFDEAKAWW